jgi:hypothetical protein
MSDLPRRAWTKRSHPSVCTKRTSLSMYVPKLDICSSEMRSGPSDSAVVHVADVGGSTWERNRLGGCAERTVAAGRFE